ncbi:poly [ADP-ribose] polymerase tankyrase-1-like [Cloeon dipterum]|uniref:poly [ADP-ribose] polymerase tankyrase-1-like n=1 Tax=Cloeon dipterum TaxID=197152 RepID=UPI00322091D4
MSILEALAESDPEYVELVREMRQSIVDHNGSILSDYEVITIERVVNRELEARHKSMIELLKMEMSRTEAERAPVLQLYHGSPCALEIAMNGFKSDFIAIHSMFGEGIYFSSLSSKSNQYAWGNNFGTCPKHRNRACIVCPRRMLVCSCYMGKPFVPRRTNQPVPAGFHSVIAEPKNVPGLRYPEFVVLNTAQALPRYLITYKIKP